MNSTTIPAEITTFASKVREALGDLPSDEVDDLTDGLEADLAEEYAGERPRALPEAAAYAMELRTAAGLPPTDQPKKTGLNAEILDVLSRGRRTWEAAMGSIRANPAGVAALDFVAVLAPAWWVLRAYVAAWLVMQVIGVGLGGDLGLSLIFLIVLALAVLGSVQLGRGRWSFAGAGAAAVVGNLFAVLMLVLFSGLMFGGQRVEYVDGYEDLSYLSTPELLTTAGVGNIYAYDAQGQPLDDVQLFDQDGRPLSTVSDDGGEAYLEGLLCARAQPARLITGAAAYNVFPLQFTLAECDYTSDDVTRDSGQDLEPGNPLIQAPFVVVPAVEGGVAADDTIQGPTGDEAQRTTAP